MSLCSRTPRVSTEVRDFLHRLENASFVIRRHDRNQRVSGRMTCASSIRIDAVPRHSPLARSPRILRLFEMFKCMQDCVMFGVAANQMPTAARMTARESENSEIVRLRAAACEDQFVAA